MKRAENQMKLYLPSMSVNEGMARSAVASFVAQINPTLEEISDIKCAVSEAVTNSIVHGYKYKSGIIYIGVKYYSDRTVVIEIRDNGCGIENVKFHTLRHTFATHSVEGGFETKSLSEILGHSSVNITLNRYVHSSMETKRANMEKLAHINFF